MCSGALKKALGYLPQGAPTSPMLSNLVMRELDGIIQRLADAAGLTYTRYSDDLTFSTRSKEFSRFKARGFISEVGKALTVFGFQPQHRKTKVVPPGSRKLVLGLQVEGDVSRLTREFKDKLRQHLYYLEKHGAVRARKNAQIRDDLRNEIAHQRADRFRQYDRAVILGRVAGGSAQSTGQSKFLFRPLSMVRAVGLEPSQALRPNGFSYPFGFFRRHGSPGVRGLDYPFTVASPR